MFKKSFVIIILSAIILTGCSKKDTNIPKLLEPVENGVDTAVVTRGDIYELTTYDASVYPEVQEVYFETDGTIGEIAVYPGMEVKKGDILISLDNKVLNEELNKLEEELEDNKANNNYDNNQQNFDIQIAKLQIKQMKSNKPPEIEVAKKEAELKKLELLQKQALKLQDFEIRQIEKKIEDLKNESDQRKIVAPCAGSVVYVKNLTIGDSVNEYDTMVIIADKSKLHIQSNYIKESVLHSASQMYAIIKGKNYNLDYIPLTFNQIMEIQDGANIESRFNFTVDDEVKSGDYACICLKDKVTTNVLNVPKKALFNDTNGTFVYKMKQGEMERCYVETGTKTDNQIEITSGLEEGDVVYVQE